MHNKVISIFIALLSLSGTIFADDIPTIPLHISIISERHEVTKAFTEENTAWIAETLNREFKSGEGKQLLRFELKQVTQLSESRSQAASFFGIDDQKQLHQKIKDAIKEPLLHPDKLNIYVFLNARGMSASNGGNYCAYRTTKGIKATDCYTWILLDWQVLEKKNAKILLHEAGHVFGLPHTPYVDGDKKSPNNNIMAGDKNPTPVALPDGESGYYFTPSQTEKLKIKLDLILATFSRARAGEKLIGR
jgi:hypothetical protein